MAQQFGAFKRSSVTKMLIAELSRTVHTLPKQSEGQYEAQTYLSPTGRVVAKVLIAGTAIEKENIGKDEPLWRLRISDPSGSTAVMASRYQPEAAQVIAGIPIPAYVCIVGKLNIYEPEPGSHIVSLRPDSVTLINGAERDALILDAALSTVRDVKKYAADPGAQKVLSEAYENRDSHEAYTLMAQQAIESLLPNVPPLDHGAAEKLDQNVPPSTVPAVDEAKPAVAVEVTKPNDIHKAGEADKKTEKQEERATPPVKLPPKPKASPSPSSAPAYPKGAAAKRKDESKAGKAIESSIRTVQEVVLGILQEKGTVVYDNIPALLKEKGVNPNMVDWTSAVKRLMQEGYCCEPKLGVLRYVR